MEINLKGKSKRYEPFNDKRSDKDSDLEVILQFIKLLTKAIDYKMYDSWNRDFEYTPQVVPKLTNLGNPPGFQRGDTIFKGDDPIAIVEFC